MIRALLALALGLALGFGAYVGLAPVQAAVPGPSNAQLNPDIYQVAGFPSTFSGVYPGDLQSLNPLSQKLRAGARTITYSYVVVPGCSDGNMRNTLAESLSDATANLGIGFVPVSSGADVTIRATCGVDAANMGLTGGAIADLYPSWPYKSQVNASTTMATFYDLSQETIWSHEIVGHALATWNEQYQLDGYFSPTPGLVDFMNTGDQSREVAWPQNDVDRWSRTMYDVEPAPPPAWGACSADGWVCWSNDAQLWVAKDGWTFNPETGVATPHFCATDWCGYWTGRVWLAADGATLDPGRPWQLHPN